MYKDHLTRNRPYKMVSKYISSYPPSVLSTINKGVNRYTRILMYLYAIIFLSVTINATDVLHFTQTCSHTVPNLHRFYGSRPHPDLSMISKNAFWNINDENLQILPTPWKPLSSNATQTIPFVDTHVAVRFLGGVSKYESATNPSCVDIDAKDKTKRIWCDLVVRNSQGILQPRFDLIHSRLDRYVQAGINLMIVLDNVPYAFVTNHTQPCQNFGCQYLPPDDPEEFAQFIQTMASYLVQAYGMNYVSNIRWRLGTEANGPRWGDRGLYFNKYWQSYQLTSLAIRKIIPLAEIGASNWVEASQHSGILTKNGSDAFQYQFYTNVADSNEVALDFVSISHYGSGKRNGNSHNTNFPQPDWLQIEPANNNELEIVAMKKLANRSVATLEIQEWSILKNEESQATFEPSSLGTAWTTASATTWMCQGVNQIFHWETGATLRNVSGNGRMVNFYEQFPWSMGFLEMFLGGVGSFTTFGRSTADTNVNSLFGVDVVAVIESEKKKEDVYLAMVSAVAQKGREVNWMTQVELSTLMFSTFDLKNDSLPLKIEQWIMNTSTSVVEQVIRDMKQNYPEYLQKDDGLPYRFDKLLTKEGMDYVQGLDVLNGYWEMHTLSFVPKKFEGVWSVTGGKEVKLVFNVTAPCVVVVKVEKMDHF